MRTKFLVAVIAIAGVISVASCHWFSSFHGSTAAFNIQGKWTVDSIGVKKDSSGDVDRMLLALANIDSVKSAIEFNADSTYTEIPGKDSVQHKYYVKEKELFVEQDSAFVPYQLNIVNDSLVHLLGKDSLFIALKRQ